MKILSAFNHKGGVGKTTMTFNLACRLAESGKTCLVVDADPQCNTTIMALDEEQFEPLYSDGGGPTVYSSVHPLIKGTGDIDVGDPIKIDDWDVYLLPGDLYLGEFEDVLAREWNNIFKPEERAVRFVSALYRVAKQAGAKVGADYIFFDLGPSIGPLNQAAIISCDGFMVPVTPDIFSVRALSSVGATVRRWVDDYEMASKRIESAGFGVEMPAGKPKFLGYVPQQFGIWRQQATQAFQHWIDELEDGIRKNLTDKLDGAASGSLVARGVKTRPKIEELQNYHSLVPAAQKVARPIFALRGNIDVNPGHVGKVESCGDDYDRLMNEVLRRV